LFKKLLFYELIFSVTYILSSAAHFWREKLPAHRLPLTFGAKSFPLTACRLLLARKVLRSPPAAHFWREKFSAHRLPPTFGAKSAPLTACRSLPARKVLRSPPAVHSRREKYAAYCRLVTSGGKCKLFLHYGEFLQLKTGFYIRTMIIPSQKYKILIKLLIVEKNIF